MIAEIGVDRFVEIQSDRIEFLETALTKCDDGRSKNFFCIAAVLLSVESLQKSLVLAENGELLKTILTRFVDEEGQELKLRK